MKNLSEKSRKRLTITGLASLCVVLLFVLIAVTSNRGGVADDALSPTGGVSSDVSVEDITKTPDPATGSANVSVPAIPSASEAPTAPDPVLDVESENHVEVDLTDISKSDAPPEPPNAEQNHDKPDTPAPSEPPKSDPIPQQTTPPNDSTPKNGGKKDGMVYVDGFGWIKDEGGGSNGIAVGDEGDELTGNQVGIMGD